MNFNLVKCLISVDFVSVVVKQTHIKSILYIWAVAKIQQLLQLKHNLLGYSDND